MKANKNLVRALIVLGVIFAAFSVVAFVLPLPKNGVFWLAYLFAVISIAAQGYAFYQGYLKGEDARSKLYGYPLVRIGTVYMIAQLAVSLVCMVLAAIVPVWVVVIVCVLLLAAAAVGLIAADAVREEIQQQDAILKADVSTMRALQSKARSLAGLCRDPIAAGKLKVLSEELQYSDPVSSDAVRASEAELGELMSELEKAVTDSDFAAVDALYQKSSIILAERNRICKLNKA